MIEVELRTFITKLKYQELLKKYNKKIKEEKQITYYYDCKEDFRLMKTKHYNQLWLKSGELHDEAREEKIVKIDNKYSVILTQMLESIGFKVQIKWFRIRNKIELKNNIEMCLDYTSGYGYILEIEKLVNDQKKVDDAKIELLKVLKENNIKLCPKEKFKEKYDYYKNNWKQLTKKIDEEQFLN